MIRRARTNDVKRLVTIWNQQEHPDFYLWPNVVTSQIVQARDLDWNASFVLVVDDVVQGGILIKRWNRDVIPNYQDTAWITLLVVARSYQHQGHGTALLEQAISSLKQTGTKTLHVGKDMNNLFCGIADVFDSSEFFHHNGFSQGDTSYDMHRHVKGMDPIPLRHATDYQIRLGQPEDSELARGFFHRSFPGRWEEEYLEYLRNGNDNHDFVFLFKEDKIIAFCRVNQAGKSDNMYNILFTNAFDVLYGVGPLGVDPAYRGLSLGFDVTAFGINSAVQQGASDVIIDWTGLVTLYRKFGFDIWHEYASFTKTL